MTGASGGPDPPLVATEAEMLTAYLDYFRETIAWKASGLTAAQLDQPLPPSTMTLGGMLKHLAFVEDWWITHIFHGEPMPEPWASVDWDADWDWDWHSAADDTPDELRALYDESIARSRAIRVGPDQLSALDRRGEHVSGRWILLHLVEEYARHAGHADLIRESIDGQVGE
ncbi:MAG: DinB family protein [Nocardioidaceae bacterium]